MWGTSSPDNKLTGDFGSVIEITQSGGRRLVRVLAGKLSQVARRFAFRCGPRALDANVIVSLDFGSTGAPARRDVNRKLAHLSSRATMSKLGAVQGVP